MSNTIGLFIFDIGWSELAVISLVALVAIGPKELPSVLRTFGQFMRKMKRMSAEVQSQFREVLREADVADLKQHVQDIHSTVTDFIRTDADPATPAAETHREPPGADRDDGKR